MIDTKLALAARPNASREDRSAIADTKDEPRKTRSFGDALHHERVAAERPAPGEQRPRDSARRSDAHAHEERTHEESRAHEHRSDEADAGPPPTTEEAPVPDAAILAALLAPAAPRVDEARDAKSEASPASSDLAPATAMGAGARDAAATGDAGPKPQAAAPLPNELMDRLERLDRPEALPVVGRALEGSTAAAAESESGVKPKTPHQDATSAASSPAAGKPEGDATPATSDATPTDKSTARDRSASGVTSPSSETRDAAPRSESTEPTPTTAPGVVGPTAPHTREGGPTAAPSPTAPDAHLRPEVGQVSLLTVRHATHAEIEHAELGRVSVDAREHAGVIDVTVRASNVETAAALVAIEPALRADLHEDAVALGDYQVDPSGVGGGGRGESSANYGEREASRGDRTDARADNDGPTHGASVGARAKEGRVRIVL